MSCFIIQKKNFQTDKPAKVFITAKIDLSIHGIFSVYECVLSQDPSTSEYFNTV